MRCPTRNLFGLLLASLLLVYPTADAAEQATGQVEVRVTDHLASSIDFEMLRVGIAEVSLHRRGQPRSAGWTTILQKSASVNLVPLTAGQWASIGAGEVPAGRYDAVRVRLGAIDGELRSGGAASTVAPEATVAIDLEVAPAARQAMLIHLTVEDRSDHQPGLYAVKVQQVATPTTSAMGPPAQRPAVTGARGSPEPPRPAQVVEPSAQTSGRMRLTWPVVASVAGVLGTGALVAWLRRRRPAWGPERYWVLGLGALSPAWLIAFLGTIEPPGGAAPNKPLFIITSALPLLGIILTDALLRGWRASGRLLRPVQAWLLGIAAILLGWGLALLTLVLKNTP